MCRFLIIKSLSQKNFDATKVLVSFAQMAKASRAPDGDRQQDGWGMILTGNSSFKSNRWQMNLSADWLGYRSLKPIWQEAAKMTDLPPTDFLILHARSASFKKHKNKVEFNQPYWFKETAFVFNGFLSKVAPPFKLEGKIGAEKIWQLFLKYRTHLDLQSAFKTTIKDLISYSQEVQALNLAIVHKRSILVYTSYKDNDKYYHLRYFINQKFLVIASEPVSLASLSIRKSEFNRLPIGTIVSFNVGHEVKIIYDPLK